MEKRIGIGRREFIVAAALAVGGGMASILWAAANLGR